MHLRIRYIHLQVAFSNISQTATFHCDSLLHGHFLLPDPSHVSSFPLRTVSPTLSARAPQFCLSSPVIITNKDSLQGSWRSAFRELKVLENQQNTWYWDQQLSEWTLEKSAVLIYPFENANLSEWLCSLVWIYALLSVVVPGRFSVSVCSSKEAFRRLQDEMDSLAVRILFGQSSGAAVQRGRGSAAATARGLYNALRIQWVPGWGERFWTSTHWGQMSGLLWCHGTVGPAVRLPNRQLFILLRHLWLPILLRL